MINLLILITFSLGDVFKVVGRKLTLVTLGSLRVKEPEFRRGNLKKVCCSVFPRRAVGGGGAGMGVPYESYGDVHELYCLKDEYLLPLCLFCLIIITLFLIY